jgi:hypothetical protein
LKEGKASESGGDSEKDLAGFKTGLEASRNCAGVEIRKGLDVEKFLPFASALTEIV